jgi:uncharacterized membrane protein
MNFVILALFLFLGLTIIVGIVASMVPAKAKATRADILRNARQACRSLDA